MRCDAVMTIRQPVRVLLVTTASLALMVGCGDDDDSTSPTAATTTAGPATTTTGPATTTTGSATTTTASTSGTSSAGTSNAALCSARDQLKTSIQGLTSVDLVKNGTSGLQQAVDDVKTNLATVKSSASSELKPQVTALETSLQQLQTALSDTGSAGVAGVVSAAKGVAQSGSALVTSLDNLKCS
jgi:hypothetical protein